MGNYYTRLPWFGGTLKTFDIDLDILYHIFLFLPYDDLVEYSCLNEASRDILRLDQFWQEKSKLDYPLYPLLEKTWKRHYLSFQNDSYPLTVWYQNRIIEQHSAQTFTGAQTFSSYYLKIYRGGYTSSDLYDGNEYHLLQSGQKFLGLIKVEKYQLPIVIIGYLAMFGAYRVTDIHYVSSGELGHNSCNTKLKLAAIDYLKHNKHLT